MMAATLTKQFSDNIICSNNCVYKVLINIWNKQRKPTETADDLEKNLVYWAESLYVVCYE